MLARKTVRMNNSIPLKLIQLLKDDPRYRLEAYQFVREALVYAQETLKMEGPQEDATEPPRPAKRRSADKSDPERHLTGQQLCEAIRHYATDQYGYLAKAVLNSWGVHLTKDFGEIVYNLIHIGYMKKSARDRREDFHDQYDFHEAFQQQYQITPPK